MKQPLYILGSGGFAKEVCFLANDIQDYEVRGFLDIQAGPGLTINHQNIPVLAESLFLDELAGQPVAVALGIGDPHLSCRILARIKSHPAASRITFPNLIHPSFIGSRSDIQWGEGNVVTAGVIFTVHISVGNFNIFNLHTTVGHDSKIGSYNVFNPGCNISGGVELGDRNLLGTNATVLQMLKLGSDLILGASSLATKNLPDGYVYVGSPAKPIRELARA